MYFFLLFFFGRGPEEGFPFFCPVLSSYFFLNVVFRSSFHLIPTINLVGLMVVTVLIISAVFHFPLSVFEWTNYFSVWHFPDSIFDIIFL